MLKRMISGIILTLLLIGMCNDNKDLLTARAPLTGGFASVQTMGQAEQFSFFSVTVTVNDVNGQPIQNAWIKAFSENWGISFPHFEDWARTSLMGSYEFNLPLGNWSIIASSGYDYMWSHPNKGFFIETSISVNNDLSVELIPDTSTTFTILDEKSNPLRVDEIFIFDEEHTPVIAPAIVGQSQSGSFTLYASSNLTLACLFYEHTDSLSNGYLLIKRNLDVGEDITISVENSAEISFNGYDPNHDLCEHWNVEFRLPELYLGNWVFSQDICGKSSIYVTPTKVVMNPRYIPLGWYYYFEHIPLKLESEGIYDFSLGGCGRFKLWIIRQRTQLWFNIRDEYENVLAFFAGPDGTRHINLKIFEGMGLVYEDDVGQYMPGTLFHTIGETYDQEATYELDASLGPFGNLSDIELSGQLYSEDNIFHFERYTSPHFILDLPAEEGFQEINAIFTDQLENVYVSIGEFVEEELEGPSHCIIDFEHCGAAGTSLVIFGLGIYRWPGNLHPGFLGVLSHELGHLYSFTPPICYGVKCPLYCEPLATYLGIEGVAGIYDQNVRLWFWSCHPWLLDYLMGDETVGEVERMQFLFFYIHQTYSPRTHKQFFRIWNSELKDVLCNCGFSSMEATCTLYSYLVEENLAWLFQLAGFDISEERVNEGLSLLQQVSELTALPNTALPLSEVNVVGTNMTPDSSFIMELDGFDVTPSINVSDHSGKFNVTITVPPIVAGEYNISVQDSMRQHKVAFGVERAFTPSAPPNQSLTYLAITSAAVIHAQRGFQFVMHVMGTIPSNPGSYTAFIWFVDTDKNASTGQKYNDIGSDFNVRVYFDPNSGWGATVDLIDQLGIDYIPPTMEIVNNTVIIYVPPSDLGWPESFHWAADAFNSQWLCFVPDVGHVVYPREPSGGVEIKTEPIPGPIYIDGFYVNDGYAMVQGLPPGNHTVSFGGVYGYVIPEAVDVTVTIAQTLNITGIYSPSSLVIHDVAVLSIESSKTVVCEGYNMNINVTVENQGDVTETFNVSLYYECLIKSLIETQNVTLTPGQSITVNFTWAPPLSGQYTIIAEARVTDDNIDDNELTTEIYVKGEGSGCCSGGSRKYLV